MATLKDLLDSGMSRDEINALLSQSYVGTDGFQQAGYEQGPPVAQEYPPSDMLPPPQYRGESMANTPQRPFAPQPIPQQPPRFAVGEDGLSRMTDRPGEVEQAPMNTIRNNSTGVVTQMPSSGQRSHDVWADGPQEIGRYQLANGTTEIIRKIPVMRDGRQSVGMERLIETPDYLNPVKFKQLEYQKREAEVRNLNERPKETGTWSTVESNGKQYLINNKTGAIKPAEVGGEQLMGKKGDGAKLKEEGAADVNVYIAALRDAYNRLDSGGGITNTDKGWVDNSTAGIASSGVGQVTGKIFGTQNQSARNDIAMTRPALLAALMKSTGMSAKQMDSNVELKLWLSTATDPTLDVQSNRRALDKIEMKYLGGDKIGDTKPTEPKQPSQEIVERSTSKSGKPIVKRKGSKDWEYE